MHYLTYWHRTEDRAEHAVTDFRLFEFLATYPFALVVLWQPLSPQDYADLATFRPAVQRLMRP